MPPKRTPKKAAQAQAGAEALETSALPSPPSVENTPPPKAPSPTSSSASPSPIVTEKKNTKNIATSNQNNSGGGGDGAAAGVSAAPTQAAAARAPAPTTTARSLADDLKRSAAAAPAAGTNNNTTTAASSDSTDVRVLKQLQFMKTEKKERDELLRAQSESFVLLSASELSSRTGLNQARRRSESQSKREPSTPTTTTDNNTKSSTATATTKSTAAAITTPAPAPAAAEPSKPQAKTAPAPGAAKKSTAPLPAKAYVPLEGLHNDGKGAATAAPRTPSGSNPADSTVSMAAFLREKEERRRELEREREKLGRVEERLGKEKEDRAAAQATLREKERELAAVGRSLREEASRSARLEREIEKLTAKLSASKPPSRAGSLPGTPRGGTTPPLPPAASTAAASNAAALEKEKAALKDQLQKLKEKSEAQALSDKEARKELEAKVRALEKDVRTATSEAAAANRQIETLKNKVTHKEEEILKAKERLREEMEKAKERLKEETEKTKALMKSSTPTTPRPEAAKPAGTVSTADVQKLEERVKALTKENAALRASAATTAAAPSPNKGATDSDKAAEIAKLKGQVKTHEEREMKALRDLTASVKDRTALREANTLLVKRVEELEKQLLDLQTVQKKWKEEEEEKEKNSAEGQAALAKVASLEKCIAALEKEKADAQSKAAQLQQALDKATAALAKAQSDSAARLKAAQETSAKALAELERKHKDAHAKEEADRAAQLESLTAEHLKKFRESEAQHENREAALLSEKSSLLEEADARERSLQTKAQELTSHCHELEERLHESETRLAQEMAKREEDGLALRNMVSELQASLEDDHRQQQQEAREHETERSQLQAHIAELKKALLGSEKKSADALKALEEKYETLLEQRDEELQHQEQQQRRQSEEKGEEEMTTQKELEELRQKVEQGRKEVEKAVAEKQKLEQEKSAEIEKLKAYISDQMTEASTDRLEKMKRNEQLQKSVEELKESLTSLRKEHNDLTARLTATEKELASTQSASKDAVAKLTKEKEFLIKEVERNKTNEALLHEEKERLLSEIDKLKVRVNTLVKEQSDLHNNNKDHSNGSGDMSEEARRHMQSENKRLLAEVQVARQMQRQAAERLELAKTEKKVLASKFDNISHENEVLSQKLQKSLERETSLPVGTGSGDGAVPSADPEKVAALEKALQQERAEKESLQEQVMALEEEKEKLTNFYNMKLSEEASRAESHPTEEHSAADYEAAVKKLLEENEALQSQVARLERDLANSNNNDKNISTNSNNSNNNNNNNKSTDVHAEVAIDSLWESNRSLAETGEIARRELLRERALRRRIEDDMIELRHKYNHLKDRVEAEVRRERSTDNTHLSNDQRNTTFNPEDYSFDNSRGRSNERPASPNPRQSGGGGGRYGGGPAINANASTPVASAGANDNRYQRKASLSCALQPYSPHKLREQPSSTGPMTAAAAAAIPSNNYYSQDNYESTVNPLRVNLSGLSANEDDNDNNNNNNNTSDMVNSGAPRPRYANYLRSPRRRDVAESSPHKHSTRAILFPSPAELVFSSCSPRLTPSNEGKRVSSAVGGETSMRGSNAWFMVALGSLSHYLHMSKAEKQMRESGGGGGGGVNNSSMYCFSIRVLSVPADRSSFELFIGFTDRYVPLEKFSGTKQHPDQQGRESDNTNSIARCYEGSYCYALNEQVLYGPPSLDSDSGISRSRARPFSIFSDGGSADRLAEGDVISCVLFRNTRSIHYVRQSGSSDKSSGGVADEAYAQTMMAKLKESVAFEYVSLSPTLYPCVEIRGNNVSVEIV